MSDNVSSNIIAEYSEVDLTKKGKSRESLDQISIAEMRGSSCSNVTAKYSAVDLSKKKNRKPSKGQDDIIHNEDSTYDVLKREYPLPEALSVNQPNSSHGSFISSASPLAKVGLAVTVFLVIMALVVLTVLIIILFLKVSSLEAAESNSNSLQNNKKLQKYFDSFDYINSTFNSLQQELTVQTSIIISNSSYQHNISFLENIYREITSLNYSLQTVANNLRNDLHSIISYNKTCPEIAKSSNDYSSGDYILKLSTEAIRTVYCDMTSTLGGSTLGWMRIAKLDVNNCPQGFRTKTTSVNSVNACIRSESNAVCTEIHYSTHNVQYSNISGAVRAIGHRTLEGFRNDNLGTNYLDGVSVSSNNEHIWSFTGGCSCEEGSHPNKPGFVGDDYICSAHQYLWRDQQQCGSHSSWFFKMLPLTTADINVRVCRDQASVEEGIALTELELYIQ